jgi:signal transduction histidine kinase
MDQELPRPIWGAVREASLGGSLAGTRTGELALHAASSSAAARRARLLEELSTRLAEALTPHDVGSISVEHAVAALDARHAITALLHESANALELTPVIELPPHDVQPLQWLPLTRDSPLATAARTGDPVFVESADELRQRFPDALPVLEQLGIEALAVVPAVANGRVRGALGVGFGATHAFDEGERRFITAVASQFAQAVLRARLYEAEHEARCAAERAAERTARLQGVTAALSGALAPVDVGNVIVREGTAALGAFAGGVLRVSDDGQALEHLSSVGFPDHVIESYRRFPLTAPIVAAEVVRRREPIFIERFDEWAEHGWVPPTTMPPSGEMAHGAWAALPLLVGDRVLGVMTLSFDGPRHFGDDEPCFMMALAHQCAQALERARLFEEAVAANRAKATFLATVSHELRTPLAAVLGYTELVADGVLGSVSEMQHDHLRRAIASGEHLLMMIEDILSFARVDAGREEVHVTTCTLSQLVEDAISVVTPLATKKRLVLEAECDDGTMRFQTDPQKLRQIVVNLLANAIKFTEQGRVTLSARAESGMLQIVVTDTGPGIAPEHLERIFEPFWQVDQGFTRTVNGTGLGLSVARHLARLLGGDVTAASTLGAGSAFSVRLPLTAPSV